MHLQIKMDEVTQPSGILCVNIPAGTVVEIEVACDIRSRNVNKGDQIKFRLVDHLNVDSVVVIAAGAPVTFTVYETEGHQQSAGLKWSTGEVIAVDGTQVPLQILDEIESNIELEEMDRQAIMASALFFPCPTLLLLYGFKRRGNSYFSAGKRYHALIQEDLTILASKDG